MSIIEHGTRAIYVGDTGPDVSKDESGVAFENPGTFDVNSDEYRTYTFYPDGDGIGYHVKGKDLKEEVA